MSNLLQKIAELSPEKRALLLQKLNQPKFNPKVEILRIFPYPMPNNGYGSLAN
jgi:hypothetical protein